MNEIRQETLADIEKRVKTAIHRLNDMGRYWDDGKPQPSECADLLDEVWEMFLGEKQAHEADLDYCNEHHEE